MALVLASSWLRGFVACGFLDTHCPAAGFRDTHCAAAGFLEAGFLDTHYVGRGFWLLASWMAS